MKSSGQMSVFSVIGVVIVALFIVFFVMFFLPEMLKTTMQFLSTASSEVVSRELAGMITVSAAAPDEISLTYDPPEDLSYLVVIDGRIVSVVLQTEVLGMKGESIIKTGIDSTCDGAARCSLDGVKSFTIDKSFTSSSGEYGYACNVGGVKP